MGRALQFLGDVPFRRDLWFPHWARQQPGLKFAAWDSVPFFEKGFLGEQTESMPILVTTGPSAFDPNKDTGFWGGVSLAPQRIFATRAKPVFDLSTSARRTFADYSAGHSSRQAVISLDGASYRFADHSSVRVTAENVRRQNVGGELANREVTRTIASSAQRQTVALKIGSEEIGIVAKDRTGANAFRVGFESRSVDLAQAVAARASNGKGSIARRLTSEPHFDGVVEVAGKSGTSTYVRVGRTREWIEVAPDPVTDVTVASGWTGRAARPGADGGLRFRPATEADIRKAADGLDSVAIGPGNEGGVMVRFASAEPVAGVGRPITISFGDAPIKARVLEDGSIQIATSELPPALRAQPERLANALTEADLAAARSSETVTAHAISTSKEMDIVRLAMAEGDAGNIVRAAAQPTKGLRLAVESYYSSGLSRVDKLLQNGEPHRALQEVAMIERLFGNTSELALRRAIAELRIGRPEDAARAVNSAPPGSAGKARLNKELIARLEAGRDGRSPPPPGRGPGAGQGGGHHGGGPDGGAAGGNHGGGVQPPEGEARLMKVVDYRRRHPGKDDVHIVVIDKEPHFALKVADDVADRPPMGLADVQVALSVPTSARPDVFVDPKLVGKFDWSEAALRTSMKQVVAGDLGKVVRLPIGEAAAYQPSIIYAKAGGKRYRRVTTWLRSAEDTQGSAEPNISASSALRTPAQSDGSCDTGSGDVSSCNDELTPPQTDTVLVVVAR
jgi:hypothetical protein